MILGERREGAGDATLYETAQESFYFFLFSSLFFYYKTFFTFSFYYHTLYIQFYVAIETYKKIPKFMCI